MIMAVEAGAGATGAGQHALLWLCLLLGLIAVSLVFSVLASRRQVRASARIARDRAIQMRRLLQAIRLSENISQIGVWQYNPATGHQQWSDGMRVLFGIDPEERFDEGDADTILAANHIDLVLDARKRSLERSPFILEYDKPGFDGGEHKVQVQACNLFARDGSVDRVIAVVREVSDPKQQEKGALRPNADLPIPTA
ncbi:MAG: hypothetical protein AAGK02_05890 [Pseudomonadota bacterium]